MYKQAYHLNDDYDDEEEEKEEADKNKMIFISKSLAFKRCSVLKIRM